jgi:4-aminobutyrate aminotransferase-like enzyme
VSAPASGDGYSLLQRRHRALGRGAELFYDDPVEIVRGEGPFLFDRKGHRYVDLYNNVPCVGHGNPAVAEAMARQQATLNVHSRYLHEGIVAFAERLAALHHPGIESVVFSCSGTEANEVALRMAREYTGFQGHSLHGRCLSRQQRTGGHADVSRARCP